MNQKIKISGTGCALADYVYNGINFEASNFKKYLSLAQGDGGLSPGKLVFTEELENFASQKYPEIIAAITQNQEANTFNIGGPSLVSLIHAAQMLPKSDFQVDFYGISGNDQTSARIRNLLEKTPVGFSNYRAQSKKPTPFTHVLSDPDYENGNGERTFINNIGAAWDLTPNELPAGFFNADIVCFGGTALTPHIHDKLHALLKRAKTNGAITVVNTVYDFRNEKQNPKNSWPLGDSEASFPNIDVLIMDNEEAKQISGCSTIADIVTYFSAKVNAFIVTRGPETTLFYSNGKLFDNVSNELPVSWKVTQHIQQKIYNGDTTGCGDNFVGGVVASIAGQIHLKQNKLNLEEAVIAGICSGGFACSYNGGTYFEKEPEEKKQKIQALMKAYHKQ